MIVDAEGASALRELIESGRVKQLQRRRPTAWAASRCWRRAPPTTSTRCARGSPMRAQLDALLSRYDALVAPTRGGLAPPDRPRLRRPAAGDAVTRGAAGREGAARAGDDRRREPRRPARDRAAEGLRASDSLPSSLQLLGRAFSEATLVAIARRLPGDERLAPPPPAWPVAYFLRVRTGLRPASSPSPPA